MTKGEKIRSLRKSLGLTQDELGYLCGINKQLIYKYETGIVTNIPSDKFELLAKALHTTPDYLMGWTDNASDEKPDPAADYREVISGEGYRLLLDASANLTEAQVKAVADFIKFQQSQNDKI